MQLLLLLCSCRSVQLEQWQSKGAVTLGNFSSSWETTPLRVVVSLRYSRVLPTSQVFRSGYIKWKSVLYFLIVTLYIPNLKEIPELEMNCLRYKTHVPEFGTRNLGDHP